MMYTLRVHFLPIVYLCKKVYDVDMTNKHYWNTETSRCVSIMQYLTNPATGQQLWSVEAVQRALDQIGADRYVFIVHKPGTPEAHIHLVVMLHRSKRARTRSQWAEIFGVPEEKVWKHAGAEKHFYPAIEYMLHDAPQHANKEPYTREDLVTSPGWDWETGYERYKLMGKPNAPRRQSNDPYARVARGEIMPKEALQLGAKVDAKRLRSARHAYLVTQRPPSYRLVFYLQVEDSFDAAPFCKAAAQVLAGSEQEVFDFRIPDFDVYGWEREKEFEKDTLEALSRYEGERLVMLRGVEHGTQWGGFSLDAIRKALGGSEQLVSFFKRQPDQFDNARFVKTSQGETAFLHDTCVVMSEMPLEQFKAQLLQEFTKVIQGHDDASRELGRTFPILVEVDTDSFKVSILEEVLGDDALGSGFRAGNRVRQNLRQVMEEASHHPNNEVVKASVERLEHEQLKELTAADAAVRERMTPRVAPEDFYATFSLEAQGNAVEDPEIIEAEVVEEPQETQQAPETLAVAERPADPTEGATASANAVAPKPIEQLPTAPSTPTPPAVFSDDLGPSGDIDENGKFVTRDDDSKLLVAKKVALLPSVKEVNTHLQLILLSMSKWNKYSPGDDIHETQNHYYQILEYCNLTDSLSNMWKLSRWAPCWNTFENHKFNEVKGELAKFQHANHDDPLIKRKVWEMYALWTGELEKSIPELRDTPPDLFKPF
ncbi:hypothetical protein [Corynebacterium hadale]|uniref:hypothetical protein n=1 Tax=Corynebacterium hadale TaxID=2026255 RepID=UPI000BAA558C|nr:hypothetical protein [Corynebacterium hadale]